jgi:hypothetical protein
MKDIIFGGLIYSSLKVKVKREELSQYRCDIYEIRYCCVPYARTRCSTLVFDSTYIVIIIYETCLLEYLDDYYTISNIVSLLL